MENCGQMADNQMHQFCKNLHFEGPTDNRLSMTERVLKDVL